MCAECTQCACVRACVRVPVDERPQLRLQMVDRPLLVCASSCNKFGAFAIVVVVVAPPPPSLVRSFGAIAKECKELTCILLLFLQSHPTNNKCAADRSAHTCMCVLREC